jgi:hypothetical protein
MHEDHPCFELEHGVSSWTKPLNYGLDFRAPPASTVAGRDVLRGAGRRYEHRAYSVLHSSSPKSGGRELISATKNSQPLARTGHGATGSDLFIHVALPHWPQLPRSPPPHPPRAAASPPPRHCLAAWSESDPSRKPRRRPARRRLPPPPVMPWPSSSPPPRRRR